MPQRNGQNPTRAVGNFAQTSKQFAEAHSLEGKNPDVAGLCPNCNTEIPPKPGFRVSSLKCPKCGTALGKNK